MTFLNRQSQPTSDPETEAILNDPAALAAIEEAEAEAGAESETRPPGLTQTERLVTISSSNDQYVWFKDLDAGTIRTVVAIDRQSYDDMDEPDTLTVTVRPGDHLNTDD